MPDILDLLATSGKKLARGAARNFVDPLYMGANAASDIIDLLTDREAGPRLHPPSEDISSILGIEEPKQQSLPNTLVDVGYDVASGLLPTALPAAGRALTKAAVHPEIQDILERIGTLTTGTMPKEDFGELTRYLFPFKSFETEDVTRMFNRREALARLGQSYGDSLSVDEQNQLIRSVALLDREILNRYTNWSDSTRKFFDKEYNINLGNIVDNYFNNAAYLEHIDHYINKNFAKAMAQRRAGNKAWSAPMDYNTLGTPIDTRSLLAKGYNRIMPREMPPELPPLNIDDL